MKDCPKITVIICMYKGEATVSKMIDCVLNQTYRDLELILVNDGSPDKCGEIAEEYAKKDERVRVLHKPNGGLADARNKALEIAKGEYTIQFDQDDWVDLNCLEEMCATAMKDNADMVICDNYHNDKYAQKYAKQTPTALDHWTVLEDVIMGRSYGYCWNKLIRLDAYRKYNVKFPLEFYGCEDQYGMCQLLKNDIKVAYLPKAFYHYVYVEGSLSRYYDEKTYQNDLLVRKMFTSLLKGTPSESSAYSTKSCTLFTRAFLFGKSQYTSSEFKNKFAECFPYIPKKGIKGKLYKLSCKGYYQLSRTIFGWLFLGKQLLKRIRRS